MHAWPRRFWAAVPCTLALIAVPPAAATTFTVTKTADTADGACEEADCSLREAVIAANASAGPDDIVLPAGDYRLSIAGGTEDAAATGDLDVNDDVTISGANARTTDVDARPSGASPVDRVFEIGPINASAKVTIQHLTIQGGAAMATGADFGGGIENWADLTLDNVTLKENNAGSDGGGISNDGTLVATKSTAARNTAGGDGGGLWSAGAATITNVTATNNRAPNGQGGGVAVVGGTATFVNDTSVNNSAASGNGSQIFNASPSTSTKNSIVSGASPVCAGTAPAASGGHNVVSDSSCLLGGPGDIAGVEAGATILDTSAETDTLGLRVVSPGLMPPPGQPAPTSSPALDAAADCPSTDQRGVARPQGAACDAGAWEARQADLGIAMTATPDPVGPSQPITYTLTMTNAPNGVTVPAVIHVQTGDSTYFQKGSFANGTASQGGCTPDTGGFKCDFGSLAGGATATATVTWTNSPTGGPQFTSIATIVRPAPGSSTEPYT